MIHVLEAGENDVMWCYMLISILVYERVFVVLRTLGTSAGHKSMILAGAAAGEEVIIHTFAAMDVGMLMLLAFLDLQGTSFLYTSHVLSGEG